MTSEKDALLMRLLVLVLLGLIMILGQSVVAQGEPEPREVDCNEFITADIEMELEPFDYIYACDTGYDCYLEDFMLCHFQLAIEMVKTCETDDLFCRNDSFLTSASIYIEGETKSESFPAPPSLIDIFPQVLSAFSASEFETAIQLLQDPNFAHYFPNPLLYYSRGLLYEMLGEPETALHVYDQALEVIPNHPLIHYTRGLLYGRLDQSTLASFETAWIEDYLTAFAPDLLPLAAPLTEAYPLDMSRFSMWMKYSVSRTGRSPMGDYYSDRTQIPPAAVRIGAYDELDGLLAIDVSELRYPRFDGDVLNTYFLRKTENQDYEYDFRVAWGGPDTLTLEFRNDIIFGTEYSPGAESHLKAEFILAPLGDPDPRQAFGEPTCEGGVISRLRPGMFVREMAYSYAFSYAESPGGPLDQYFIDADYQEDGTDNNFPVLEVRVTENFTCIGDELWWEVSDESGNRGWRSENIGTEYQITPKFDLNELLYCPSALRTRLYIKGEGRVMTGLGDNNLRAEPGAESELLTTIPEGGQFTVVEGPVCVNGMAWWQVEFSDVLGWTAEGDSEVYWVEPILP